MKYFLSAILLLVGGIFGPARAAPVPQLQWAPPTLINPVTITITSSSAVTGYVHDPAYRGNGFDPTKDYIVQCDPKANGHIAVQRLAFLGGHNVVMKGCYIQRQYGTAVAIYPPVNGVCTGISGRLPGTFLAKGMREFYMEGVLFDIQNTMTNWPNYGVDAIDLGDSSNPNIIYVLQNVRITGIWSAGCGGPHADGIQDQGPIGKLYIDHVTIVTGYQGLTLEPKGGGGYVIQDGRLDNINIRYMDPDYSHKNPYGATMGANGYAWYAGAGESIPLAVNKMSILNNYVEYRTNFSGHQYGNWCYSSIGPTCLTAFPNFPVNGDATKAQFTQSYLNTGGASSFVTEGDPPGGDYVPQSMILDSSGNVIYAPVAFFVNPSP